MAIKISQRVPRIHPLLYQGGALRPTYDDRRDAERVLRLRAAERACRDSARWDAALRPSRFNTPLMARERFADGLALERPLAVSRAAFLRVAADAFLGADNLTPARRALLNPMAMACLALRAPCFPSRI